MSDSVRMNGMMPSVGTGATVYGMAGMVDRQGHHHWEDQTTRRRSMRASRPGVSWGVQQQRLSQDQVKQASKPASQAEARAGIRGQGSAKIGLV